MKRLYWRVRGRALRRLARLVFRTVPRDDLVKLGSGYGGWIVPTTLLTSSSICYCAGVGEDVTFDLGLIGRFGCQVHAFDPTPRAAAHVEQHARDVAGFHFHPLGLWSEDVTLRFYAPLDPGHVSHSIVNLQGTAHFFEAPCRRLSRLAKELGHGRIDLVKLDVEGAEYEVLRSMLEDGTLPHILCVEFDQPSPFLRMVRMVRRLQSAGYELSAIDRWNYTFVRHASETSSG